ncbi:MAG TPA: protein TolR [Desulfobacteraceae bacterium]|nr:protein TolR [Desulfobacteraceae bacterium]
MGPKNGGGRRGLVAEINVTPLVDVMLVLLIIFMVTAPMMTQGLEVNLPETTAKSLRQKEEPLIISLDKDGNIKLGNVSASPQYLWEQLNGMSEEEKKNPVYLRADKDVPYGKVVVLMADIKRAGFEKLGMLTQPEDPKR